MSAIPATAQPAFDSFPINRSKFPPEEVAKYPDEWVAWSADGTTLVAHHHDLLQLADILAQRGIDSSDVVFESVPQPDEIVLL